MPAAAGTAGECFEFRRAIPSDAAALAELRLDFMRLVKDGPFPDEASWRSELRSLYSRDLATAELVCWLCLEEGRIVATGGIAFGRGAGPSRRRAPGTVPGAAPRAGSRARPGTAPQVGPLAEPQVEALILNMYTVPDRRRRGLATELLGRCIEEGRSRGAWRLRLQPTEDSRRLYEDFGFRPSGGEMTLEF